jgi:hypothetical protein
MRIQLLHGALAADFREVVEVILSDPDNRTDWRSAHTNVQHKIALLKTIYQGIRKHVEKANFHLRY